MSYEVIQEDSGSGGDGRPDGQAHGDTPRYPHADSGTPPGTPRYPANQFCETGKPLDCGDPLTWLVVKGHLDGDKAIEITRLMYAAGSATAECEHRSAVILDDGRWQCTWGCQQILEGEA